MQQGQSLQVLLSQCQKPKKYCGGNWNLACLASNGSSDTADITEIYMKDKQRSVARLPTAGQRAYLVVGNSHCATGLVDCQLNSISKNGLGGAPWNLQTNESGFSP